MEVVTGVASSVVEKILERPVRLIGRHLGYLICYQTNKKSLTDRVPELKDKIRDVQRRARAAKRKGEELEECVTGWISEAERKVQEARGVIDDRDGSFPNLVSRYKLSKKAKLMAEDIVIDLHKADNFENFSYLPHLEPSFKNKDYVAFETRMQTSKEIMEAFRDPNLTRIGVYGMGGIGKTTLVTDVARQAKEEECFSELVTVTVSEVFDLKSIQNRIAEGLGLPLDGENMAVRAERLQNRLRQGNKILIILDDIWNELDLSKAGIDFNADGQNGSKILLVSRVRDVLCNKMGVTKIIEVKVLSDSEALGLFNKFVGYIDDNSEIKELANQVVEECGGLPIAIETIACSLKNKDLYVWNDFLSRLKSSLGMEGKVCSSIKASYDFLESEEEKKVLLLCSLHGEDENVRVNDLMFYGIGLDLFEGVHTMEEARCRAHSLVDKLKAHCLLLDGDDEDTVKMHDVIRDVMISIAKKDEHMHCLTKVAELEDGDFRESTAIMLLLGPDIDNQLLPSLVCPKLQLLLARRPSYLSFGTIPDDFLKQAQELKALSFDCEPLQSLPQSFCTLRHLRALRLRLGKNEDLTLIGELRNLIALDLSRSTFSQLPEHIGKLTRLRSLNLSGCYRLEVIQPNVISSLVRLEALYMDGVNIDWEVEGRVGEGRNASLVEFKNLQHLTTLHLNVRDADVLPKDMFSKNLQRFRIMIGSRATYIGAFTCSLDVSDCPNLQYLFTVAMAGRLAQVERLRIRGCPVMEEVVTNKHGEGRLEKISFPKLKYLELEDLPNLKRFCIGDCIECPSLLKLEIKGCGVLRKFISNNEEEVEGPFFNEKVSFPILEDLRLLRMNLKILWADQLSITSCGMQNLKMLAVVFCESLSHLFPLDVARSLLQLETLHLSFCKDMEEVLVTEPIEEGTPQKISFPKLKILQLRSLPNIRWFCAGCCIELPSLTTMTIEGYPAMRTFITDSCNGASRELMGSEARQPFFNGKVAFPKLEALTVEGLNSINYLFSFAVHEIEEIMDRVVLGPNLEELTTTSSEHERPLKRLKNLRLIGLSMLTHLYEDSEGSENSSLESLEFLHIRKCDRLKSPLLSSKTSFQNLVALVVLECSSMINLLAPSTAKTLVHLRSMSIIECKQMTEIIADEIVDDEIVFGKLEILELVDLPSLRNFHSVGNSVMRFPNLVMLIVSQCPEMRRFSFGTIVAPKLDSISEIEKDKYRWYWLHKSNFDSMISRLPKPQQKLWEGDINKTLEKLWERKIFIGDAAVVH